MMALPVLPLSSLASRVVLAHDLDTRELPLHLHKQLEGYRRLEGAFTFRPGDVAFEVQRIDGREVSEEEREEASQFYLQSDVVKMMMETEPVSWWPTENRRSVGRPGGQGGTTVHLIKTMDAVHDNLLGKYQDVKVHRSTYLANGKVVAVSKVEKNLTEVGTTEVSEDIISFEISESDCLTMVQRFQNPLLGLAFIFTIRASRDHSWGERAVRVLTPQEHNLIEKLLYYQEEFKNPSEAEQQEIDLAISMERSVEDRMSAQITQHSFYNVKLLIEFSRRLPGFETFPNCDQVAMLKTGSRMILLLRAARCFNPLNNTIVFCGKVAYDLRAYEMVGLNNRHLFHFCRKVHRLAVDPTEFALLTALVMFTDSPLIVTRDQMDKVQSFYMTTLVTYVSQRRANPCIELAALLGLLVDLRSLVEGSTEHCLSDKMRASKLPPLLAELWDIPNS